MRRISKTMAFGTVAQRKSFINDFNKGVSLSAGYKAYSPLGPNSV